MRHTEGDPAWLDADHEPFPAHDDATICGGCGYAIDAHDFHGGAAGSFASEGCAECIALDTSAYGDARAMAAERLYSFIVTLESGQRYQFWAENEQHAREQAENAEPGDPVTWVDFEHMYDASVERTPRPGK